MTDNIETMRGVIADALSNPAGTCANSCEGNAYQIEIRRLIADRAKLEERLEKAEQALSRAGFVRNELYGEWKPPVNRAAAKLRWRIAELESQLQAAWEQAPVNARLLEALKAAKVALQKVVEDCGGCEHEAGVCVCPELAAISQSGEAIAAAESQHAGPVRLTETQVIEIGGFQGGAAPGYVTEPCPDCAGAQHERQEAPAIGLRDCNSKNHGGQAATPQCGYLMRTTDPGCTGCVERDEDQRAEAGG